MSDYMFQYLPCYTVGADAYERVPEVCGRFGRKAVAVGGHRALVAARPYLEKVLKGTEIEIIEYLWYGGEASLENAQMVAQSESYRNADMLFAVGGGKALDTCKYAARFLGPKPVFAFPTIAATCAASSAEAIMYYPTGEIRDTLQLGRPVEHIFINTEIIAKAPDLYLWAGIGDTMAKHFETELASRGKPLSYKQALGVEAGTMCYKPLVQYGAQAIEDCKNNVTSEAFEKIVLTNVITTGMVSGLVGVTLNTGIAHCVCYGLTFIPRIEKNHLHGELVSYGVLVQLFADGKDEMVEELYPLYQAIHLPTKMADIEVRQEDLETIIQQTLQVEDISCVPYEVTGEMILNAMQKLEAYRPC